MEEKGRFKVEARRAGESSRDCSFDNPLRDFQN